MRKRLRSRWITFKETPIFGINVTGYETDREGARAEIEAAEEEIRKQARNALLVVLDLAFTEISPEIVAFLNAHSGQAGDPIRKMAIVGISGPKRIWYRLVKKVTWPKSARFFDEHEKAKTWLVMERF